MCIGMPMQVLALEPGFAQCEGRGEFRRVSTVLIDECKVGDWLLVFMEDARELIDAERAREVNEALDLVTAALGGTAMMDTNSSPFTLPSAMSAEQLAALLNPNK